MALLTNRCICFVKNCTFNGYDPSVKVTGSCCSFRDISCKKGTIFMSMNTKNSKEKQVLSHDFNKTLLFEKVDKWIEDSVVEIVRNLYEAPLLIHVYSVTNSGALRLVTEKKAVEKNWPEVIKMWERGESPVPEGMIFIEQLKEEGRNDGHHDYVDEATRAWGIVVQGREMERKPVCYLLKTTASVGGVGVCTHFCLMRVESFRETAMSQLKNCWLLQTQN